MMLGVKARLSQSSLVPSLTYEERIICIGASAGGADARVAFDIICTYRLGQQTRARHGAGGANT